MRKVLLVSLLLISVGSRSANAQVLSPGDIAIVGLNADNPDEFAFVALVDIPSGTQVTFTDHGWQASGSFRATEDEFVFTASNTIARGTTIRIGDTDGSPQFSTSGDQLFAFQNDSSNPQFLYGLNVEGAGVWQGDATSSNTSALPPALQNGLTAVALDECDNVVYAGATTGTKSDLLSLIGNKANWSCDNTIRQDLALAFTVTGAGNNIPVFTQAFADTTIQVGVLFDFQFAAEDIDADPLQFGIAPALEPGADLDTVTGRLKWTPSIGQVGQYSYTVSVTDGTDTAQTPVTIAVAETVGPTAPFFTSGTEPQIFNVGESVSITFTAEDPQGTAVTIELVQEPFVCPAAPCTIWDPETSTITWSADNPDIFSLVVKARDADNDTTVAEVIGAQIGELYGGSPSAQDLFDAVAANAPAQTLGYNVARDTMYGMIDLDSDSFVRGIYTGFAVEYTGGDPSTVMFQGGINAEHTWPQSMGAGQEPQRSDLFALFPAKDNVNSTRGNHPYAEIPDNLTQSWFRLDERLNTIPTANIDEYSESIGDAFEPRESVKGDVARAIFYFFTVHNSVANEQFFRQQENTLAMWVENDPVSTKEIVRSFRIRPYQGNMNPFILDPSLVRRLGYAATAVEDPSELPQTTQLMGNYPNPFIQRTTISYRLAKSRSVKLAIFNILGERVAVLEDEPNVAGNHAKIFDATNLAPGIYFYTLTTGNFSQTKKMVLLN